jgi:hypothetical protein
VSALAFDKRSRSICDRINYSFLTHEHKTTRYKSHGLVILSTHCGTIPLRWGRQIQKQGIYVFFGGPYAVFLRPPPPIDRPARHAQTHHRITPEGATPLKPNPCYPPTETGGQAPYVSYPAHLGNQSSAPSESSRSSPEQRLSTRRQRQGGGIIYLRSRRQRPSKKRCSLKPEPLLTPP